MPEEKKKRGPHPQTRRAPASRRGDCGEPANVQRSTRKLRTQAEGMRSMEGLKNRVEKKIPGAGTRMGEIKKSKEN